jgi:hypothetical protein
MRICYMFLAATAIGTLCASTARAEDFNEFEALVGSQGTSFSILLQGNIVASIDTTAMQTDATVNPFYYVNQNYFSGSGTSTVTATASGGNTLVTFTGSNPILPGYTFSYGGSGNGDPHFGLDPTAANGSGPSFKVLSQAWSNNATKTQLPSLTVNAPTLGVGTVNYVTFFADVTSNGQTVGQWFEVPYTGGTPPSFAPQLYTAGNATLSNVGFMLSPTQIPLDQLNFGTEPPPGSNGTPFTALSSFDGANLTSMPEPGCGVLAVGLTGLLLQRRRRRAR